MAMLFKPTIIGNDSLPKQLKINHFYAKFCQKCILCSIFLSIFKHLENVFAA